MITIEICDKYGNLLDELTGRFTQRSISQQRNNYDVIQLGLDLDDIYKRCKTLNTDIPTLFANGQNIIRIKKNGVVLSVGEINNVYPNVRDDARELHITANGWLYKLGFRYTGSHYTDPSSFNFSSIDAGQVAWSLINSAQSVIKGNMGFSQGTIQASFPVTIDYDYKRIIDAITLLSESANGFDFEITPDKVFNVWYPKIGRRREDISFTYPGNIREIPFERDGTRIVNRVIQQGAGSGANRVVVVVEDAESEGTFGIRETISTRSDLDDTDALTADAQGLLQVQKNFIDMPQIVVDGGKEPQYGSYQLGDEIPLICEYEPLKPFNDWYRIDQIDVEIDENEYEKVTLHLVRVI